MFRPLLAFATLCLAAFLLAPTVASVHETITDLHVMRETPWNIFEWHEPPQPQLLFPDCGGGHRHLYSEVTEWPERIRKDEPFTLRGVVQSEEDGRLGVGSIRVDLFLNETKTEPGVFLAEVESDAGGNFALTTSLPFELAAARYHLVAHAKEKRIHCTTYFEHWSDPETDVLSPTFVEWVHPDVLIAGRNDTFGGRLVDIVGAPVRNATVAFVLDGKTHRLVTNDTGGFGLSYTPLRAGELRMEASYEGGDYYDPAENETELDVEEELFVLDGGDDLRFARSANTTLSGHVYVADAVRKPNSTVTIRFDGIRVATCDTCAPTSNLTVRVAEDDSFQTPIRVVSDVEPGSSRWSASGGGLRETYRGNVTVFVQPVLVLEARHTGFFSRGYEGSVNLTDEVGRPLSVPIALGVGPLWSENETGKDGLYTFEGKSADCGPEPFVAQFNGTDGYEPARATAEPTLCGYLAFLPPWLLAIPWWVWPLAAILAFAGWQAYRGWRQRYAPVILGGPALTFAFTEPRDEAAGYAAVGEAIVATAFLEQPLPDGHRLRIGSPRRTAEVPLDADLRAHHRLVPDKLGELPLRAEVLDAKGRVVSRRTLALKVVRYAEEIESRYLALRAARGASDAVTPREFERWLHERAPGLDPDLARRLVHVFEEADYSPRVAGRAEFAAYLMAEKGVQEVAAIAT